MSHMSASDSPQQEKTDPAGPKISTASCRAADKRPLPKQDSKPFARGSRALLPFCKVKRSKVPPTALPGKRPSHDKILPGSQTIPNVRNNAHSLDLDLLDLARQEAASIGKRM